MGAVQLMTKAEYARHRGCSDVAVHKAVEAGRISLIEGRIDPKVADIQWAQNTRVRMARSTADATPAQPPLQPAANEPTSPLPPAGDILPGNVDAYSVSKARQAHFDAKKAEVEYLSRLGELVDVAEFEKRWAGRLSELREGLLQLAARLAPMVVAERDQGQVQAIIDGEVRRELAKLTGAA